MPSVLGEWVRVQCKAAPSASRERHLPYLKIFINSTCFHPGVSLLAGALPSTDVPFTPGKFPLCKRDRIRFPARDRKQRGNSPSRLQVSYGRRRATESPVKKIWRDKNFKSCGGVGRVVGVSEREVVVSSFPTSVARRIKPSSPRREEKSLEWG